MSTLHNLSAISSYGRFGRENQNVIFDTQVPETFHDSLRSLVDAQIRTWTHGYDGNPRKELARARRAILEEDFAHLVAARIHETFQDLTIKSRILQFVSLAMNPAHDITNAVACVYKNGARRTIRAKGKRKTSNTKVNNLKDFNNESAFDNVTVKLNRYGWFVGPTLEMPQIRAGRIFRQIIHADEYDVIVDESDPFGAPIAAAWTEWVGDKRRVITYDVMFRTEWNHNGEIVSQTLHGVVDEESNPVFPGTVWRFDIPSSPEDWWSIRRHQRLVDATVEVAFLYSLLGWVRKSQNRHIIALFGNLDKLGDDQVLDTEVPLELELDADDPQPQFHVQSMDVDPENFIKQIMFTYRGQIEAFGIPQSSVTFDFSHDGTPAAALSLQHEKLSQIRNENIPFARRSDHSSNWKAVSLARAQGHRNADGLPTIEEIKERFAIDYPEINRVDDPDKLQSYYDWQLQRGQTTLAQIYQLSHPDLTLEECDLAVKDNLKTQAVYVKMMATHEMDPGKKNEDPPAQNGREGGKISGPRNGENEDERRDE